MMGFAIFFLTICFTATILFIVLILLDIILTTIFSIVFWKRKAGKLPLIIGGCILFDLLRKFIPFLIIFCVLFYPDYNQPPYDYVQKEITVIPSEDYEELFLSNDEVLVRMDFVYGKEIIEEEPVFSYCPEDVAKREWRNVYLLDEGSEYDCYAFRIPFEGEFSVYVNFDVYEQAEKDFFEDAKWSIDRNSLGVLEMPANISEILSEYRAMDYTMMLDGIDNPYTIKVDFNTCNGVFLYSSFDVDFTTDKVYLRKHGTSDGFVLTDEEAKIFRDFFIR